MRERKKRLTKALLLNFCLGQPSHPIFCLNMDHYLRFRMLTNLFVFWEFWRFFWLLTTKSFSRIYLGCWWLFKVVCIYYFIYLFRLLLPISHSTQCPYLSSILCFSMANTTTRSKIDGTTGEISSNLYRASVCDMKEGPFLLISLSQILYYTL